MSMTIADPGGANPFDTSTIGHSAKKPEGWEDTVEYRTYETLVPGRPDHVELADPDTAIRELTIFGFIVASSNAELRSRETTLRTQLSPPDLREISFPDDPNIIATGRFVETVFEHLDPWFIQRDSNVILTFRMADPRRFDISGGRPGTALP